MVCFGDHLLCPICKSAHSIYCHPKSGLVPFNKYRRNAQFTFSAVTALSTGVALETGMDSAVFAVSAVFAIITMFDATGVRRQAGEQAIVLNQLVADFNKFVEEAKTWQKKAGQEKQKELKEPLGHKPIEVLFGGLTGILLTLGLHYLFS